MQAHFELTSHRLVISVAGVGDAKVGLEELGSLEEVAPATEHWATVEITLSSDGTQVGAVLPVQIRDALRRVIDVATAPPPTTVGRVDRA